jgi:hypothetical protein
MFGGFISRQRSGGLKTIGTGHYHIHEDEIGFDLLGPLDTFFTAFGSTDLVATTQQQLGQNVAFSGRIVNDQNGFDGHGG